MEGGGCFKSDVLKRLLCLPPLDIRDTVKYKEVMRQYPFSVGIMTLEVPGFVKVVCCCCTPVLKRAGGAGACGNAECCMVFGRF